METKINHEHCKKIIKTPAGDLTIFALDCLRNLGIPVNSRLPYSIKVLLENVLRNFDNNQITIDDIRRIAAWSPQKAVPAEILFFPGRVILQDFTGVPCVVDLAAMRSAMKRMGGDILKINPQVPCDLVIDHSLQIDSFGSTTAFEENIQKEFERNAERYEFLKWGQNVFKNFSVIPPGTGIIHQVNLEYLAKGLLTKETDQGTIAYPDSLVGTDSHTTMINSLGIVGWGVGGIEAEAVMLGEPISMLLPEVIGFNLTGTLPAGSCATDLVLTITQILREKGVVGKFVEFFGQGYESLRVPDRAVISNMSPEYGATMGFMPVDKETLAYYRMTGRDSKWIDALEQYYLEQGMFYKPENEQPVYSDVLTLDLNKITPSLAGPKRPQDRIALKDMRKTFTTALRSPIKERGYELSKTDLNKKSEFSENLTLNHGSVVIASITSCTNTSNPTLLVTAALLAKNAVTKGLKVPEFVKTSFVPGSQVVEEYLSAGQLLEPLEKIGFHIVGYGCATCIGNSGPLPERVAQAVMDNDLVVASVLSGNRNFEGRINPLTKANYLASPPLVIAYALCGTVAIDLDNEPLGTGSDGQKVFLGDIWPKPEEVESYTKKHVTRDAFLKRYSQINKSSALWEGIKSADQPLFPWNEMSTYLQEPPFFIDMNQDIPALSKIDNARVLVKVGDSITTDHISPAGDIALDSPAGQYLSKLGIAKNGFNSYGSRRGNDRVMTRGTFANIRLRNQLAPGTEGSWTTHFPTGKNMSIYDASKLYQEQQIPLIVLAGKEYGTGSSRDWAAKGTALLGVKAVIAESYERIHRSNLAGMGILPLQYQDGISAESLGLKGDESFEFLGIDDTLQPGKSISVIAVTPNGSKKEFLAICKLDTPAEIDYFRNGGILQTVLRKILKSS